MNSYFYVREFFSREFLRIRLSSTRRALLLMVIFALVMIVRSPDLIFSPRLWAEEGTFYFSNLQDQGLLAALSLQIRGNFQLLTNLIAYFATFVPAGYAAHVTTYLSLAVSMMLAAFIGLLSVQHRWPLFFSILLTVIIALLPQGYEIYLTATNVQWVCSVTVLILSIIRLDALRLSRRIGIWAWVFACGLTGVPSAMLAPIFLMRKWVGCSKDHFQLGLVLSLCALIQAVIIFMSDHPDRYFSLDPFFLMVPILLQTILTPLIGVAGTDFLAMGIRDDSLSTLTVVTLLIIATLVWVFAFVSAKNATNSNVVPLILLLSWIGISVLNVVGSIGHPIHLVSAWGGGRYFFLGSCCFVLLLAFSARAKRRSVSSMFALALLIMVAISGVREMMFGGWKNWLISGKSWKEEVNECQGSRPCDVAVWPGGEASTFKLLVD